LANQQAAELMQKAVTPPMPRLACCLLTILPEVSHTVQLAMDWGTLHEPKALMAVACSLGQLAAALDSKPAAAPTPPAAASLAECGLFIITQHAAQYHNKLPPVGASPDGILWLYGQMQAVVEAKCRFPFVDNEEHGFQYIGCKQYGKVVLGRQC
jgi:hypothetical protein